ncbi:putative 3'-N-debenzoyl-2'-deoxytaxol N-benzoyltransferase [Iris pallida]|uniref:3'-N-debenzoyl-2'-deoxytaxol N-benzoyltransferase n=1 Tax=Iris pallida TaxID=29817 RepID=A0AAX6HGH9_IRIPA|nr:putative 3'-N-debenzoyl-2'-deoxytaxol N-benzoyltransferase [Iris pallida]
MSLFSVTKRAPELVGPSEPTPAGHRPFSPNDDTNPALRFFLEMILVFGRCEDQPEPAKAVRGALARALVPYYPVAGRIVTDADDASKLQVACTGEGAWFVEASAGCSLAELEYMENQPHLVPKAQLLPSPPQGVDHKAVPFMMQVTEFKCGGFVVGIKYNHVMFDGLGIGQFMVAIGDMARGLPQPTVKPVWCRELVPRLSNSPKEPPPMPLEPVAPFKFEDRTMDVSLQSINELKSQFVKETGRSCSVFDVVAAKLWQSRTRAADLEPDVDVAFLFPVSVRKELGVLPEEGGYYGNCVFPVVIQAPSQQVVNASLSEIVSLVKDAKDELPAKFRRFLNGDEEHENPFGVKSLYGLMGVTDFRRLGVFEVDYGWGTPKYVISPSVDDNPMRTVAGCTILNSPAPKEGVRLVTNCVVKEHLEAFRDEMKKWAQLL